MSKQNRVYEVARQFKVSSQAMVEVLNNIGFETKGHMSPVNELMFEAITDYFQGQKAESLAEEARKKEVAKKRKEIEQAGKEAAKTEKEAVAAKKKVERKKGPEDKKAVAKPADEAARRVVEKLSRVKSESERIRQQAVEAKRLAEEKAAAPQKPAIEEEKEEIIEPAVIAAEEETIEVVEGAEPVEPAESADTEATEATEEITVEAVDEAEKGKEAKGKEVDADEAAGRLSGASLRERIRQSKEARETEGSGPKIIERRAPKVKERRPQAPRPVPAGTKRKKKRKKGRKTIDAEEVKSTIKETLADIRSGHGRTKTKKRRRDTDELVDEIIEVEEKKVVQVTEFVSVSELATQMGLTASDIIAVCFQLGLVVTMNQRLEMETIEFIADEFGFEVESIEEYGADFLDEVDDEQDEANLTPRAPVVTVMGHVDHGKTSLLDFIRRTRVVAGEVGGITQHIGAYEVETEGGNVTFLDTPGHEAFTAMRARGAQLTDLVVLVVAADDKVMPQTVEAINHAKAAGVPMIVAVNKIDLPTADPDGVKQQLTQHNIVVEEYGGDTVIVPVSAKTGEGVDKLLELILLQSEMLELKADRTGLARGVVLEAELDKGRGPVATVLVQKGELKDGDPFLAGMHAGRARALFDTRGKPRRDAHPSQAVQILGFDGLPQPGDSFHTVADEKEARTLSQKRQQIRREQEFAVREAIALSDVRTRIDEGEIEELPLIVKGDTEGSVEALSDSFHKLSTEEVQVRVIHQGVGGINERDVTLAQASSAIVVGFHVRPDRNAREVAEEAGVEIRLYDIIYEAVEDIKQGLEGLLKPEIKEEITGTLEVRDTFRIPKVGAIAGCMVVDGEINRNSKVRLIRDGVVVFESRVGSLRRFKDDVKEVRSGFECGVGIENYNDAKVGDVIEVYQREEIARTL